MKFTAPGGCDHCTAHKHWTVNRRLMSFRLIAIEHGRGCPHLTAVRAGTVHHLDRHVTHRAARRTPRETTP